MSVPKRTKQILVLAVFAFLAAGAALVATQKPSAPDVTFTSLTGQKIALKDLRGKIVLINFWATSCPGCIQEMPELVSTYNEYHARGFETIAVAMSYDPPNYVLNYTQKNGIPFRVALDSQGDLAKAFNNVQLTPTSFVIDQDGRIVQQTIGNLDFAKLHAMLDKNLS